MSRLEAVLGIELAPVNGPGIRARVKTANQRARLCGATHRLTFGELKAILTTQDYRCFYCRSDLQADWEVDHKTPMRAGGSNEPHNLAAACSRCNHRKQQRTAEEFAERLAEEASA